MSGKVAHGGWSAEGLGGAALQHRDLSSDWFRVSGFRVSEFRV